MKKTIWLSLLLLIGLFSVFASMRLGIGPASFEFDLHKGKDTRSGTFVVMNAGPADLEIKMYPMDFTIDLKGEKQYVSPNPNIPYSLASWIKVEPTNFRLNVGDSKPVRFTVSPPTASIGTKIGMIFAEGNDFNQTKGNLMVTGRVGTSIRTNIDVADIPSLGDIISMNIGYRAVEKLLWVSFVFQNQCLKNLLMKGTVEIQTAQGQRISTAPFFDGKTVKFPEVYPYQYRMFEKIVSADLEDGQTYKTLLYMDYGGASLLSAEKQFTVQSSAQLKNFVLGKAYSKRTIPFSFNLTNTGSTILSPSGDMRIFRDKQEKAVAVYPLSIPVIYPGETITVNGRLPDYNLNIEQYTLFLKLQVAPQKVFTQHQLFFVERAPNLNRKALPSVNKPKDEWD